MHGARHASPSLLFVYCPRACAIAWKCDQNKSQTLGTSTASPAFNTPVSSQTSNTIHDDTQITTRRYKPRTKPPSGPYALPSSPTPSPASAFAALTSTQSSNRFKPPFPKPFHWCTAMSPPACLSQAVDIREGSLPFQLSERSRARAKKPSRRQRRVFGERGRRKRAGDRGEYLVIHDNDDDDDSKRQ